jgi:murein DD-endopeptidase MepM/ murein hydrolase activator NlpD
MMRRTLVLTLLTTVSACAPRLAPVRPSAPSPVAEVLLAGGPEGESSAPTDRAAGPAPTPALPRSRTPALSHSRTPALSTAANVPSRRIAAAIERLRDKELAIPVAGVDPSRIEDSFTAGRDGGERQHNAVDILAPRNTPIVAADDGVILRMSSNSLGGITIFAADRAREFVYYYAHLDHYQKGLKEGQTIKKGETIGFVGTTGNAPKDVPHLHFQIMLWSEDGKYWIGEPVNPYPVLHGAGASGGTRLRFD